MKAFSQLFAALDGTTSTRAKTQALVAYFKDAPPRDAAWALYFLAGGKPRQTVPSGLIRITACEQARIAPWLFDESYHIVGDLAETVALVLPPPAHVGDLPLHVWIEERLLSLRGRSPADLQAALIGYWDELDTPGRFLLTKLIGGGFRVGVARLLVLRALAETHGVDVKRLAQRFMGYTDKTRLPTAEAYEALLRTDADAHERDAGQPYPFFLAHPLQAEPSSLGRAQDWQIEWKWDGIRAQLVHRQGRVWLWSRGEELISERFPELQALGALLPADTVLDGEVLIWRDGQVQPFAQLQTRIGRKTVGRKLLADCPAVFMAYDLLEWQGEDVRAQAQAERRALLTRMVAQLQVDHPDAPLQLSPTIDGLDWPQLAALREEARARGVEGFMLKNRASHYGTGRTKDVGVWWKWKIDPLSIDAVILYAQRGHGRRANLYTDFTFAVWDRDPGLDPLSGEPAPRQLVPFAKAYSGLTDEEMKTVDQRIRETVTEKFGPVRAVSPTLVVELGFEGIQASPRHKSGLAVRFPRMLRLRWDKPVEEADSLVGLRALLPPSSPLASPELQEDAPSSPLWREPQSGQQDGQP
ncbi:MAG: ATP-dependent DNA ligase [Aquabacterium sp.]